ncbi:hypothetical protein MHYP_G00058390 [Metynnis hypsauchen]
MDTGTDIIVRLPRFKPDEESSLEGVLSKIGIGSLFQAASADLTGMSSDGGLYLSAVAHKAFVDVNEEVEQVGGQ